MVRQVVQRAGRAPGRLKVVRVVHGTHEGGHHLRRVHDGVPARLLLRQLVDHHGRLAHHNLVLVVQQFDQLRDSAGRKVSIVLRRESQHFYKASCHGRLQNYKTNILEREREMFYLTTHSTHFIYGYMASGIW